MLVFWRDNDVIPKVGMRFFEHYLRRWQASLTERIRALETPSTRERGTTTDFSTEERQCIVEKARTYVTASFSEASVAPLDLRGREQEPVDLDIAFWVAGELRASTILAERLPLSVALERSVTRSLHDGRFRPLRVEELSDLRIEVTLFGNRWTPLSPEERQNDVIDPGRGYVALIGERPVAWYLPTVHNCRSFRDLQDFTTSLLYGKGRLSSRRAQQAIIYTFPTVDWIETVPGGPIMDLAGPIPAVSSEAVSVDRLLSESVDWMLRREIVPGVFSVKMTLSVGGGNAIDWARLGFTAEVLAEIGRRESRDDCLAASLRVRSFLERHLEPALFVDTETKALAAAYAGQAALTTGARDEAGEWAGKVDRFAADGIGSPLVQLQIATLFARLGGPYLDRASMLYLEIFSEWEKRRAIASLALYPQLISLALALFQATGEDRYRDDAFMIGDWFAARQNPDGSFPASPGSGSRVPYIRGTGKIMEVLALFPERYSDTLMRTFVYAASFQYTDASLYHIPSVRQADFRGGFRHDPFNREAWIDAAGHVALAAIRFLDKQKHSTSQPNA